MAIEIIIRPECDSDIDAITAVTKSAFANPPYSRQTEHFIVKALRADGALAVSLVAQVAGRVAGHIAFSRVAISDGTRDWYGMGPVSVTPDLQRRGIGKALIREGLSLLKLMGAKGCVLVGDPRYYERFGFRSGLGITHQGVPDENVLALAFENHMPRGQAVFHDAFKATN
jgi:putative acetyltransferase